MILGKTGMTALEAFHTIHNYIDTKEMILRKGAIAAHAGEKVLIPMNMRMALFSQGEEEIRSGIILLLMAPDGLCPERRRKNF